jgi:tetratricopeptide (TPR) repeat protein
MRILTGLAITLLSVPAVFAQAPAPAQTPGQTLGQRLAALRPELTRLMETFQYAEAQAKAESLIPTEKPVFDTSSVNALHTSTSRTYPDLCQVYLMAFQTSDLNGQWEKALDYLNKALATAKENVEKGKEPLTEQRDYWSKKALAFKGLMDKNAEAIQTLRAKQKLEDYEEGTMNQVKAWEKEMAEGEKWTKFFQYDLDMAVRNVDDFTKWAAQQDKKIKDQQADIDTYKGHPGDKAKWVEAVISSKTYLDAYVDKTDKVSFVHRLMVLDPDNRKVQNTLDVILGKAAPEKEKAAPKKKK